MQNKKIRNRKNSTKKKKRNIKNCKIKQKKKIRNRNNSKKKKIRNVKNCRINNRNVRSSRKKMTRN